MRRLYEPYADPLTRIVQGIRISWDPAIVAMKYGHGNRGVVWSPCSRFIAIGDIGVFGAKIQILDAATLGQVKSLMPQEGYTLSFTFSAGGSLLTRLSGMPTEIISWDLQTGVPVSTISPEKVGRERDCQGGSAYHEEQEKSTQLAVSVTYSGCGTMFGVLFRCSKRHDVANIITYDALSSTSLGDYPIERPFVDMIWTHDKSIRFATFRPGSITVREVGFVSAEHPATEGESLPTPNNFDPSNTFLFLPTISRLAFVSENAIFVWDTQHSKLLPSPMGIEQPTEMTFSSDGRFFACATHGPEIYLWKDSPAGYTFYQKITSSIRGRHPLLSPDGRSILAFGSVAFQLWRTTDPTIPLRSIPAQDIQNAEPFVLGFSPDESLVAAARLDKNTATVLDLRSGVPRLTINAGIGIRGLRVAGNTVVVVGDGKVVTWNLPQRDHALDVTVNINDSIRATILSPLSRSTSLPSTSISSDLRRIAVAGHTGLSIYDVTTGKYLVGASVPVAMPWFTPDGRGVWSHNSHGRLVGWEIVGDSESNSLKMESLRPNWYPQSECPWTPPRGHNITEDGWMLDSNGKRLLWLPPHWRSEEKSRMWSGRFLAFLHHELPEPVILEVLE